HAEDRGRGPNAEGQGAEDDDRESGSAPQLPDAESQIHPEVICPASPALIAHGFLVALEATERNERRAVRVLGGESLAHPLGGFHLDVEAELLVHSGLRRVRMQHRAYASGDAGEPSRNGAHAAISGAEAVCGVTLRRAQHDFDRGRESAPARCCLAERPATSGGEPVVARAAVALRWTPRARDEPLVLEALERRVERTLIHFQRTLRDLLNALSDPPAVHRGEGKRLEDEQLDGAAEDVGLWRVGHGRGRGLEAGSGQFILISTARCIVLL